MNPETLATAIRIGNPASWQKAEAARDESNGMINFVTERPTKPLYYHLIPNHVSALGEENITAGLTVDKPDYIIILSYPGNRVYGKGDLCQDWGKKICRFIDDNYVLENPKENIILNKKEVLFYKKKI